MTPFALEVVLDREEASHDALVTVLADQYGYDPAYVRAVRIRANRAARLAALVNDAYLAVGR